MSSSESRITEHLMPPQVLGSLKTFSHGSSYLLVDMYFQMEDGDELLDYYISDDESESDYWARRLGRRVHSGLLASSPASSLFPDCDWESEVFWTKPSLDQGDPTTTTLLQLASRLLTFFKAWRRRRDGGCEQRRLTAANVEKCLGGEETITQLETDIKRLHSSIAQRVQRELSTIFPTALPAEVLERITAEVLREEHDTLLAFSPDQRREVGGCYQALALVFTSAKSQLFINPDVARERLLSENGNYYHNLHARLSPSIEKFQASVDNLENIVNIF